MRKFLTILLFISTYSVAQKTTFHITNGEKSISYVTIIKDDKTILGYTDLNGNFSTIIHGSLSFSHVSYKIFEIPLVKTSSDTIIEIVLINRVINLDPIIVRSNKKKKSKFETIGYQALKYNSGLLFKEVLSQQKIMLGIKMDPLPDQNERILRSIKFLLRNTESLRNKNFVMELKLFGITDDIIDSVTINRKPIYLNSSNLFSHNEVFLDENIKYPKNGFVITVMLPQISNDNIELSFLGNFSAENPTEFVQNNYNDQWSFKNINELSSLKSTSNNKFLSLAFQTTLWKN